MQSLELANNRIVELESTNIKLKQELEQCNAAWREALHCCEDANDEIIQQSRELSVLNLEKQTLTNEVERLQVSDWVYCSQVYMFSCYMPVGQEHTTDFFIHNTEALMRPMEVLIRQNLE